MAQRRGHLDGLGEDREPVRFCDADACASCGLVESEPGCLRRKAGFCLWLAAKFPGAAIGAALKKMGLDLIKDSAALDRERAVLSHRSRRAMRLHAAISNFSFTLAAFAKMKIPAQLGRVGN